MSDDVMRDQSLDAPACVPCATKGARFRLLDAIRDPGGTHDCRRRGCDGSLFHLYDDEGDNVLGLTCYSCDYVRLLSRPFPVTETSLVADGAQISRTEDQPPAFRRHETP